MNAKQQIKMKWNWSTGQKLLSTYRILRIDCCLRCVCAFFFFPVFFFASFLSSIRLIAIPPAASVSFIHILYKDYRAQARLLSDCVYHSNILQNNNKYVCVVSPLICNMHTSYTHCIFSCVDKKKPAIKKFILHIPLAAMVVLRCWCCAAQHVKVRNK